MSNNILLLGHQEHCKELLLWLSEQGDYISYFSNQEIITEKQVKRLNPDWVISYGYRHIIKKDIIDLFPNRIINLHISYLPWNRGAYPNFWAWFDDTPHGVSIHFINEGIDTGPLIVNKRIEFNPDSETLQSSYNRLHFEIQELFKKHWSWIRHSDIQFDYIMPNKSEGSYHNSKETKPLIERLPFGWETSVTFLPTLKKESLL